MSRHTRTYSKRSHGGKASIQFDKLFTDSGSRPSAAKSAGKVGKWGITSFTSIRSSSHINGSRDGESYSKRKRVVDYARIGERHQGEPHTSPSKDPFLFDFEPETNLSARVSSQRTHVQSNQPRPKKFFKSRTIDQCSPSLSGHRDRTGLVGTDSGGSNEPFWQEHCSSRSSGSAGEGTAHDCDEFSSLQTTLPSSGSSQEKGVCYGTKKFFSSKNEGASTRASSASVMRMFSSIIDLPQDQPLDYSKNETKVSETQLAVVKNSLSFGSTSRESPHMSGMSSCSENKPPIRLRIFKSKNSASLVSETQGISSHYESHLSLSETEAEKSRAELSEDSASDTGGDGSEVDLFSVTRQNSTSDSLSVQKDTSIVDPWMTGDRNCSQAEAPPHLDQPQGVTVSPSQTAGFDWLPQPSLSQSGDSKDSPLTQHTDDLSLTEDLTDACQTEETEKEREAEDAEKLVKAEVLLQDTFIDFDTAQLNILDMKTRTTKSILAEDWSFKEEEQGEEESGSRTPGAVPPEIQSHPENLSTVQVTEFQESENSAKSEINLQLCDNDTQRSNKTVSKGTRKGSIFKSRTITAMAGKKRLALYRHKWTDDREEEKLPSSQPSSSTSSLSTSSYDIEDFVAPKLTRVTTWPVQKSILDDSGELVTSVKCPRKYKEYYTVVKNVKKAHQIQESGEFQEFNDDVEYILDALQSKNSIPTRCLSAITLASKCMAPAFRMHLRAHGTVIKFFRALQDSTSDPSLALCTATVMFVLSQDRLNMDLDRESLELMLNLLDSRLGTWDALDSCGMSTRELEKNKQKVWDLCEEMQRNGHAKHLNLDNITASHLAMETLLSLTSRRAGEWFKEELRQLGGLEHIVQTITAYSKFFTEEVEEWTEDMLDKLVKIDRCLQVLENVTHQNEENQLFLLQFQEGLMIDVLMNLYRLCDQEVSLYPVHDPSDKQSAGVMLREALLSNIKLLINITHDYKNKSFGSTLAGQREEIVDVTLHCLLQVPHYLPEEKKFDMYVLAMCLLINLVEHCHRNRRLLMEAEAPLSSDAIFQNDKPSAVEALIRLFYQKEENARIEEAKTDDILDGKKDEEEEVEDRQKTQEEFIEETVAKLLHKAGRHMEDTLIAAYIALLIGYLIMDDKVYEAQIRDLMPEGNFQIMVSVLKKFYNFMNLTQSAVGSSRGLKATEMVLKFMEKCDSAQEV